MRTKLFFTPNGCLQIFEGGEGLHEILLDGDPFSEGDDSELLDETKGLLRDYFNGESVDFGGLKTDFSGYTDFQRKVLKAVMTIPQGEVRSYSESELAIISISVSVADNDSLLRDYIETYGASWIFAMDTQELASSYRVRSVPLMYFIDARGRIASTNLGFLDNEQVSSRIDQAVGMTDPLRTVALPVFSFSLVGIALGLFFHIGYRNRKLIKRQLFGDSGNN